MLDKKIYICSPLKIKEKVIVATTTKTIKKNANYSTTRS